MKTLKLGVIGGGLMGREMASAIGRWAALTDAPVRLELTAVCDLVDKVRDWFSAIPTVKVLTADHKELLASDVDVVYVAVPHHLHRDLYLDVLKAGKSLFAEKPFGIDLEVAREVRDTANELGRFVRCSSEFPFLPAVQKAFRYCRHHR